MDIIMVFDIFKNINTNRKLSEWFFHLINCPYRIEHIWVKFPRWDLLASRQIETFPLKPVIKLLYIVLENRIQVYIRARADYRSNLNSS